MEDAGYNYSCATEVIGDIGSSSSTSDCVGDLLDTVYHAVSMLSRTTDVGFGFGTGTAAGMCTIDMGAPLQRCVAPDPAVRRHRRLSVSTAPRWRTARSTCPTRRPRVSTTLLPNATAGTPIVVGFRNQDFVAGGTVTITQFSIANAAGTDRARRDPGRPRR